MAVVTPEILKGNTAEFHVASRLAKYCLVRPVPSGTDIGIDLYCEAQWRGKPLYHFWIQVKGKSRKNKKPFTWNSAKNAAKLNQAAKITYVLDQPIPVLIFMLPLLELDGGMFEVSDKVSFFSPFLEFLRAADDTVRIRADMGNQLDLNDDGNIRRFLYEYLPELNSVILLKHGILSPILKPDGDNYVKAFPSNAFIFKEEVSRAIRLGSIGVLLELTFLILQNGLTDDIRALMGKFGASLAAHYSPNHYADLFTLGVSHASEGNVDGANDLFGRAVALIEQDARYRAGDPEWEEKIRYIRRVQQFFAPAGRN